MAYSRSVFLALALPLVLGRETIGSDGMVRLGMTAAVAQDSVVHPELFGEGVFSTAAWDFFVALTPDQRVAYFCRASGGFTWFTILESRHAGAGWGQPRVASFSGRWSDADPHLSPDGSRLFFISNRPDADGQPPRDDYDIWVVERTPAGGWGAPRRLGPPVNAGATEWSPSARRTGTSTSARRARVGRAATTSTSRAG
jgi:hypothetical protein